ncbi:MAG: type VI secretion system contractile sheath small subunit [Chitinivibrionales bacterium]|nr:type VI secretion system contractile sheath small subunit [Chitinivibrionales bacterium]
MAASFQNEIPAARINLKLDVGKGGARKKTELPMKMLVVGDFSFTEHDDRVVDREKIAINKDNFGQVMESMGLRLDYRVDNKLSGEGDLDVGLDVKGLDSFRPENVAKNVPALGKLLAARNLLKDLKSNLLDNREFRKRLEQIINDPDAVKSLQEELRKLVPSEETPAAS